MSAREQDLLDEIEDAEIALRQYKWFVKLGISALGVAVLLIVTGAGIGYWGTLNGVDTSGLAVAPIVFGAFGLLGSCAWLVCYIGDNGIDHGYSDSKATELRKAERKYRRYISGA